MLQLDENQQLAVDCKDKYICCLAGAGSGKTAVMLHRIARIAEETNRPDKILALTFTNAAAQEMRERYIKLVNETAYIPNFKTFHAFCYELLSDPNICWKLGYSDIPGIADDSQVKGMKKLAMIQCRLKSMSNLNSYKLTMLNSCVDRLLHQRNLITFDALINRVTQLFVDNDSVVIRYKQLYQYIFVDEFQDTDELQWNFVKSFSDSDIFVCGDALQNIYSFRGTTNEIIKKLSEDSKWRTIKLVTNYRSDEHIVWFANLYSRSYAPHSYRIHMVSSSDNNGNLVIDRVQRMSSYPLINSAWLSSMLHTIPDSQGTTAILCRTNAEVNELYDILQSENVRCTTKCIDNGIDWTQYDEDEEYRAEWLASRLNSTDYTTYLYKTIGQPASAKLAVLDECFPYARSIEQQRNVHTTSDPQNLYIGTIHSVKGLEFDNVHVMGAADIMFPLDKEENQNLFYVAITRAKHNLYVYTTTGGALDELES